MLANSVSWLVSTLFILSANAYCLWISKKSVDEIRASALREYKLHACGRALAALKNFRAFARLSIQSRELSSADADDAISFAEAALKRRNDGLFLMTPDNCVDRANARQVVVVYLKNKTHTRKHDPNYSYRFL